MTKKIKGYHVWMIPFGDNRFPKRPIGWSKSYQGARAIIAGCNTAWHIFEIETIYEED